MQLNNFSWHTDSFSSRLNLRRLLLDFSVTLDPFKFITSSSASFQKHNSSQLVPVKPVSLNEQGDKDDRKFYFIFSLTNKSLLKVHWVCSFQPHLLCYHVTQLFNRSHPSLWWRAWDVVESSGLFGYRLNFHTRSCLSFTFSLLHQFIWHFELSLLLVYPICCHGYYCFHSFDLTIRWPAFFRCFFFFPFSTPVSSSVVSVSVESVVSSSAHPGGARAPPGGRNRRRTAQSGPTPTPRNHDDDNDIINHTWTLCHHVDNVDTAAATTHAQSASCHAARLF